MAEQAPRRLTLTVPPAMAGEKIDTLLRRELHLSGTVIRRIKWLEAHSGRLPHSNAP